MMRLRSIVAWIPGLLLLLLVFGCTSTVPPVVSAPTQTTAPGTSPTATESESDVPDTVPTVDFAGDLADFESAVFDNPTNITNKYFPLTPGRQLVFEGFTEEGGQMIPHRIVFTITDLQKEIYGVMTVVAWVEDFSNEQLVEAELAFYAQDNEGNVWFMGEYPEVYENNQFIEAPAWISGYKGALPGIAMKAEPEVGGPSYSQGWGPAVNWTDRAQVVDLVQNECVPVDCYDEVLVTEEFSESEPNAFQIKYYAPGVGNIKVRWRGDDANREELDLVELNELSAEEMDAVRDLALAMEAQAYERSKEVYDQTAPSIAP